MSVAGTLAGLAALAGSATGNGSGAEAETAGVAEGTVVELVITSPEPGRAVVVTEPTGTGAVLISVLT